jgi:hypothetical protein
VSLNFVIYYTLLVLTNLVSLWIWPKLNKAERYLAILVLTTAINEGIIFLLQVENKPSMSIYHIYSVVELCLLSMFFQESVSLLKERKIAFSVTMLGIGFALINAWFFQPLETMNTNFLLFEAALVIICCLFSLHQVLTKELRPAHKFRLFWLSCLMLVYWGVTFTGWGLYVSIAGQGGLLDQLFYQVLMSANYVFYAGIALVFINHRKLIPSGE